LTVQIDEAGRRYIHVDVEVPGTPEQVWQAIATGPGVSAWFAPTEIEAEEGGVPVRAVSHFGPGMDSVATVTAWDPPHRFAAEGGDFAPNAPPLATEWTVEARSGGVCVEWVVHSLFASSDEWDDQLTSVKAGWPTFFRILGIYLEHFRGERCSNISVMGMAPGEVTDVWDALIGALGLGAARVGARCATTGADAPPLGGIAEPLAEISHGHRLLLCVDEPALGVALLGAFNCGGPVMATVNLYLYGDRGSDAVTRDEPSCRAWMNAHFPSVGAASTVS
jgi:uncharacterized protein YndB with AHSA1/START domain